MQTLDKRVKTKRPSVDLDGQNTRQQASTERSEVRLDQRQRHRYTASMGAPREKLESVGFEWVCEQLEDGLSIRQIAQAIGVNFMTLHDWLHSTPLQSARATAAKLAGAEAHEQRAIQILDEANQAIRDEPQISGSIVALARERAQAAWRQAGVRDRKYTDQRSQQIDVRVTHDVAQLPTAELERLVAQHSATLQLEADGTVTGGGTSESGEAGE